MKATDTLAYRQRRIRQLLRAAKPAQPPQDPTLMQLTRCFEQLIEVARASAPRHTTKRRAS